MSTTISLTDRTVGELAAEMPVSIRVFEAWKIDYCCGGATPLPQACAAAGKSVDEFAAAIEAATVIPDGVSREWPAESLTSIAKHIVDTYHRYTREELDTLAPLADKVFGVHGGRRAELAEVRDLVESLAADMFPHMLKEEQVLFPYVDQLDAARQGRGTVITPFFGTVKNPVRMMMAEHDRVGEILVQLRKTTSDYELPEGACFSYRELYRRLAEFETRTHEHVHIENNVYFPRAVALEEQIGEPAQFAKAAAGGHACGCSH